MKYCLAFTLVFLINVQVSADVNPILKCLGQEELKIHKGKIDGPIFNLNQSIVNLFVNASAVRLQDKYLEKVCHDKKLSPSLMLLKILLYRRGRIFKRPHGLGKMQTKWQLSAVTDLVSKAPRLFIRYLTDLQTLSPIAGCLETEIPEVGKFLYRVSVLEADIDFHQILYYQDYAHHIFQKLENLNQVYERCSVKAQKKQAEEQARSQKSP